jgi:hypothetical protein
MIEDVREKCQLELYEVKRKGEREVERVERERLRVEGDLVKRDNAYQKLIGQLDVLVGKY